MQTDTASIIGTMRELAYTYRRPNDLITQREQEQCRFAAWALDALADHIAASMPTPATWPPLGSVSTGTMLDRDLIPCFLAVLRQYNPEVTAQIESGYDDILAALDSDEPHADTPYLTERLFDELDAIAPPYCRFGSCEGDGADYGFWIESDDLADAEHAGNVMEYHPEYEGAQIYTRVQYAAHYQHEPLPTFAAHTDDNGNVALYRVTYTLDEVWSTQ